MLKECLNISTTFDHAIDMACVHLDYARLNKDKVYNESALLAHIEKLEATILKERQQYTNLVNEANSQINKLVGTCNSLEETVQLKQTELENEKLNNYELKNKVKALGNLNRAYIHGIKQLPDDAQRSVFINIKSYIGKESKSVLLKF